MRQWAAKNRFSEWMVARLARLAEDSGLDAHDRMKFLDGLTRFPPPYVRANLLRCTPEDLARRLDARGFRFKPTQFDPAVFQIQDAPISAGATLEHLLGWSSPQDLASSSAATALAPEPGQTIVDLAASPGMKTVHLAALMQDNGALVAVEPDGKRIPALRANLERSGVSCAVVQQSTAQEIPGKSFADGVLVDAPCTGEGTIPRDRKRRQGEIGEISKLSGLQEEILDAADRILKPGGSLVYATCTFAPEENELQVARLLERGYRMEKLPFDRCEGEKLGQGLTSWPGYEIPQEVSLARRFFPGIHPTLGFFVARLRKDGE
jgi:NOL1/NOP2/sun family putative RNA methylase